MMISFEDFKKLDLRIAKIKEVEDIPEKNKLFKLTVDLGKEQRTLIAGIKGIYSKKELIGKQIVVLTNLTPKKIAGIESQGMLLAATNENSISLLTVDKPVKEGSKVE